MKPRILPILLMVISTLIGCYHPVQVIPRGQDPGTLEIAIAEGGQGEAPTEPERRTKNHLGPVLKTAVRVGETCGVICCLGGIIVAMAIARHSADGSMVSTDGNAAEERGEGLSGILKRIWSDEP
jgi:hypothetical protein